MLVLGYGSGYVYKQPELTTTSFKCMGGEIIMGNKFQGNGKYRKHIKIKRIHNKLQDKSLSGCIPKRTR